MFDLTTIPDEVRRARGDYSTVRAAHEDSKKDLQMLCGKLSSVAAQVLRKMQPDNDEVPDSVESLISAGRDTLAMMEQCSARIESLAKQKAELKPLAWGK
jgi:hypothetical protein